jgi:hypothetical protein
MARRVPRSSCRAQVAGRWCSGDRDIGDGDDMRVFLGAGGIGENTKFQTARQAMRLLLEDTGLGTASS